MQIQHFKHRNFKDYRTKYLSFWGSQFLSDQIFKSFPSQFSNFSVMPLLDCFGKMPREILNDFLIDVQAFFGQCFVCLFNVPYNKGIEIKAIQQGVRGVFYEQDPIEHFLNNLSQ